MLTARIRLGRVVRHQGQTREYVIILNGEVPFPPDDSEGVLEKVSELFNLAEAALDREVEKSNEQPVGSQGTPAQSIPSPSGADRGTKQHSTPDPEAITPRQLRFIHGLLKEKSLSGNQLENVITTVLGTPKKATELTKREAGRIINHLSQPHKEGEP